MIHNKKIILWISFLLSLYVQCESIENTYYSYDLLFDGMTAAKNGMSSMEFANDIMEKVSKDVSSSIESSTMSSSCRAKKMNIIVCDAEYEDDDLSIEIQMKYLGNDKLTNTNIYVSMTSTKDSIRQDLIEIVPKMETSLDMKSSSWKIQSRNLPNKVTPKDIQIWENTSVDNLILSNPNIMKKELKKQSTDIELWETTEYGSTQSYLSLYIKNTLRYTNSFAGHAHAEAFVHPTLISHPNPKRVAIMSETPLSIAHEVLKHKDVEFLAIYDEEGFFNFALEAFPELNDCSYMVGRTPKCTDSMHMLGDFWDDEETSDFDVILMDVIPPEYDYYLGKKHGFLEDLTEKLRKDENAAFVINVGSIPSGDVDYKEDIDENDLRAHFLRFCTRAHEKQGWEFQNVHVYEEV